jgi:hypothetical protein
MYSQPELNDNWTKVSYKRGRTTQEENERGAKHAKKANTGSTRPPLPIAKQVYWKREVKTNSRKPVVRTLQNLLHSI